MARARDLVVTPSGEERGVALFADGTSGGGCDGCDDCEFPDPGAVGNPSTALVVVTGVENVAEVGRDGPDVTLGYQTTEFVLQENI